jgi:hypothetical protein
MLTLPSHILIDPQSLAEVAPAYAGVDGGDSPPELARLPGMLAEAESCISTMIRERDSPIGADPDQLWALHATRNLLALLREAVGDEAIDAWRPHHLACAGDDLLVVVTREAYAVPPGVRVRVARHHGTEMWWFADEQEGCPRFPMRVGAACRRLNEWGARVIDDDGPPPHTWLELIGRALEQLAGLGWGPEGTQAALLVVEAILNQGEALDRLRGAARPGDEHTWLDLIHDALDDTQNLLGSEEMANALAQAHSLVQAILTGRAPLSDLLEACCLSPAADREGGGIT